MVWFKVDDSFYDHPKTEDLSDSAVALWTRAGSYCARHLTDGFISHRKAMRMCDNPEAAISELVAAGLWKRAAGGYWFHDWHEYQPTREESLAASKGRSIGGAVGNHRRWHVDRGVLDQDCRYCLADPHHSTDRSTDRPPDQSTESLPNPPSRPDPTQSQEEHPSGVLFGDSAADKPPPPPKKKREAKSPTRIPDDFAVTDAMVAWARETTPLADAQWETAKFVDYWKQATRNDLKKDWVAAWRTWMRNAQERAAERRAPTIPSQQSPPPNYQPGYESRGTVALADRRPPVRESAQVRKARDYEVMAAELDARFAKGGTL